MGWNFDTSILFKGNGCKACTAKSMEDAEAAVLAQAGLNFKL